MKDLLKRIEIEARIETHVEIYELVQELLAKDEKEIKPVLEKKKKLYRNYIKRDTDKYNALG